MKHNYIFRGWWRWMNRIAIPKIKHAGYKYKKIDSNSAELQILVYDMSEQDASSLDYGLELSDNNRGNYKGFEQVSQNNIKENLMKQDRMNSGDKIKFKNPLNHDKGIASKVNRSTIKKIIKVGDQVSANKLSLMVGDYFKKVKTPVEVAILDSKIAVPIQLITLRENTMKEQRMQSGNSKNFPLLENKLRKLVQAEIAKTKLNESSNPEGDRKIGKFIQTLAMQWDIPQIDAARYVFQYIKRRYGSEF